MIRLMPSSYWLTIPVLIAYKFTPSGDSNAWSLHLDAVTPIVIPPFTFDGHASV